MYAANEITQYADEGNEPISLEDLERRMNKINEEVIVKINNEKKFFARPGTLKNSICVRITDRYNALKQVLRSYI